VAVTTIFKGSSGLNTVQHPLRLPYDREVGVMGLSAAVNVVVDDTGMVTRRGGYESVDTGSWHSLFCDGGDCVGVKDGELVLIGPDLNTTLLRTDIQHPLAYAQVNDAIYYTSRSAYGIVRAGAHIDWVAGAYVGPDTNRDITGPFPAEHIAFHAGRMWLAVDGFLAFSEPFAFSWFDLHQGTIPMESRVRMLAPVADGMFISTETATYFLAGTNPGEFFLRKATDYPAIERTLAVDRVEAMDVGLDSPGLCRVWASTAGVCLGTPGGAVINLTKAAINYPETAQFGAGFLSDYNYVHTTGV
jgi:hypothetical protein